MSESPRDVLEAVAEHGHDMNDGIDDRSLEEDGLRGDIARAAAAHEEY